MQKLKSFLLVLALLAGYSSIKSQSVRPMVAINSGDVKGLKGVTQVNIVYEYSKMSVGAFRTEQDYINKKQEDYKKDPEKFKKFKESWVNSRKERFEPKFEELFNKTAGKCGMSGKNNSTSAAVTLKVETINTEVGMNIGIMKQPAYVDMECTFIDKDGKEIVRYFVKNAVGSQAMGYDFDAGSRLTESYAKGAKMLTKDVCKRLKKLK